MKSVRRRPRHDISQASHVVGPFLNDRLRCRAVPRCRTSAISARRLSREPVVDIESRLCCRVRQCGEQYQHQTYTSYLEDFRHQGHSGLEERAGTDQGTRAHLLDAERGRELTPGEATQVDRGQGRQSQRRSGASLVRRVPSAPMRQRPAFQGRRVGELHDDVPGCRVCAAASAASTSTRRSHRPSRTVKRSCAARRERNNGWSPGSCPARTPEVKSIVEHVSPIARVAWAELPMPRRRGPSPSGCRALNRKLMR